MKNLTLESLDLKVFEIFRDAGKEDVYEHTLQVVTCARELAKLFQMDETRAVIGAYLHDIGRTLKLNEYIEICELENIPILEEEHNHPRILHGKISRYIAQTVFDIDDEDLLNAIQYHSTLRFEPSSLEELIFLADKLSWIDLAYQPLIEKMKQHLSEGIQIAIWIYISDLKQRSNQLKLYHPLAKDAYAYYQQFYKTYPLD